MHLPPTGRRRAVRLLATALLSAAAATAAPAVAAQPPAFAAADRTDAVTAAAPTVTRSEEIRRAATWLTADHGRPVPYSQSKTWQDGYRQDCSGYVSMALRLPAPGPNTVALDRSYTTPLRMADLRQGDLVVKSNSSSSRIRHVVIFDRWADAAHSSYWTYEQAGGAGTRHRQHSYGLRAGDGYHAAHPKNLVAG